MLTASDRRLFTLVARGATLRQTLDRLLAGRSVALTWRDKRVAEAKLHGSFSGSVEEIARRLLARTDYIVVYKAVGGPRMARVIVLGPARAPAKWTASAPQNSPHPTVMNEQQTKAFEQAKAQVARWSAIAKALRRQATQRNK